MVLLVLVGLSLLGSVLPLRAWLTTLVASLMNLGVWGAVLFIGLYIIATIAFLPGAVMTMAAGVVFGLIGGTVVSMVGSVLGALAAYLIARSVGRDAFASLVAKEPKFASLSEAVGREGFRVVLLLRLAPLFPFNALNYLFGLTPVRFRDYALASVIGMFPGTILYVYLGIIAGSLTDLGRPQSLPPMIMWLGLGLTVIVTVVLVRYARSAIAKEMASDQ